MDDPVDILNKFSEMVRSGVITKKEFLSAFSEIVTIIESLTEKLKKENKEGITALEKKTQDKTDKSLVSIKQDVEKRLNKAISDARDAVVALQSTVSNDLNFLRDKAASLTNGKDADEESIIARVLAKIPANEDDEETPQEIRDKLELLIGDERLDKSAIRGLEEELKRIEEIKGQVRGGGVSAISVRQAFKTIAHTEAPSGDIDGVNTAYTVKNEIFYVFGFTLNGEQIAELPNFTYAGKTITFSSALPAAYSGKDFEIKYIG